MGDPLPPLPFDFAGLLVFFLVGALFVWSLLLISRLVQRRRPSPEKGLSYECGETPVGSAWVQFNIRFYVIALVFVIFDVEVAFLFPAAAVFRDWVMHSRGGTAFLEIMIFVGILLVGLAWIWARGDLEWVRLIRDDPGARNEAPPRGAPVNHETGAAADRPDALPDRRSA